MSHVAFLVPGLDRLGGAERQVLLLAEGMRQRNWRVSVLSLSGSGGLAAEALTRAGAAFLSLEMRKGWADPRGWLRLHRWLRRARPDVLHAHLPHAAWLARWSRLAAPAPRRIDTLHSAWTGPPGRRLGYRISGWLPDRVTAVSQAVARAHCAAGLVQADRLSIIPNGVPLSTFQPDPRRRAALRQELGCGEAFLWLAAGRLEAVKDYPTLLRALAALPGPSQLMIAGGGPLRPALEQLAAQLGLARRVRFLGFIDDIAGYLQAADGFVLSSLWEGLPMALLEAGACALPRVATNVPGTREAIANGQTGWLVPPGEAAALAAAMRRVEQMPAERRCALSQRSRAEIAAQFGLESVLDRWQALYESCLSNRAFTLTRA